MENSYFNTVPFRKNTEEIKRHGAGAIEEFDKKFDYHFKRMFDEGGESNLNAEDLSSEERRDIENFVAFAVQRLAAGAVTSRVFHAEVAEGKINTALNTFAPANYGVGHDCVHAMLAYARTRGQSLVPAYMRVEEIVQSNGISTDQEACLEEEYVHFFSGGIQKMKKWLSDFRSDANFSTEELTMMLVEKWEEEITTHDTHKNFADVRDLHDKAFVREHRLPEFVNIVRNLVLDAQKPEQDSKFIVHEFQRILRPLLDRLQEKKYI